MKSNICIFPFKKKNFYLSLNKVGDPSWSRNVSFLSGINKSGYCVQIAAWCQLLDRIFQMAFPVSLITITIASYFARQRRSPSQKNRAVRQINQ